MKRLLIILSALLIVPTASGALAFDPLGAACAGNQQTTTCQDAQNEKSSGQNPAVKTITTAIKIITLLIGAVAVILILASGLILILSAGNAEAVKNAKSRIVGAVVGLVVAALAWAMVSFVVDKLV